jgi:hypothetical protein
MMNIYSRLLLVAFLGVFLVCCRTTTFKMEVPKNAVEIYLECVTSEKGVCRTASLDTRLGAFLAPAEITAPEQTRRQFKGVDTSPNPNFINPFAAKAPESMNRIVAEEILSRVVKEDFKTKDRFRLFKIASLEHSVDSVVEVMRSPVRDKFDEIYNAMMDPYSNKTTIKMDKRKLTYYCKELAKITANNGWGDYEFAASLNYAHALKQQANPVEKERAKKDFITAALFERDFSAYFRNGEFASVSITLSNLIKRFPALQSYPPEVKNEIEQALKKVEEKLVFGRIGDAGFVTRFGAKFQFPPMGFKIDPAAESVVSFSKVDYVEIGHDLIRVFLEALFDAASPLPAVSEATGVQAEVLRPFKPDQAPYEFISETDYTRMNEQANAVESGVSFTVSKVIRGMGVFSINNEAVETLIENIVGTIARKSFEKLNWCWYGCGFPEALSEIYSDSLMKVYSEAFQHAIREEKPQMNFALTGPIGETKTIEFIVDYY